MTGGRAAARAAAVAVALLVLPSAALAAPPANDGPGSPSEFVAVSAANGQPDERQGVAELAEATGDAGVPSCLGAGSFARTVWFTVPAAEAAREISVEATGRTTAVPDLALFVQPAGGSTAQPNVCAGRGDGGAADSEEPAAAVVARVPAGRSLLVQVGRRGAPGPPEDERALLSLAARDLGAEPAPAGDRADAATPRLLAGRVQPVPLAGATTTEEDPATPECPALGGVWRRHVPTASGPLTITATGAQAATLAAFAGPAPSAAGALGCASRERSNGSLPLVVAGRAGVPVWIRVGTDRPPGGASTTLTIARGARAPEACAATAGLRDVVVRRSGRRGGLRFAFTRAAGTRPVSVDVFQQSIGRRITGERLVARFARRGRGFTWSGRATRPGRRVADGYLFARIRAPRTGRATEVRRITLRRVRGRFSVRPEFVRSADCDLLRSFKLTRPVFGGSSNRALGVSYRLSAPARVTVEVLRGSRVVRRLARRTDRAGRTLRLRLPAEGRARGEYRVRLTAVAGTRTVRAVLVSRRL